MTLTPEANPRTRDLSLDVANRAGIILGVIAFVHRVGRPFRIGF